MLMTSLDRAREIRSEIEKYSYTELVLRSVVLPDRTLVKLQSRTRHCGGTDYGDIGWISDETADALANDGVYDLRR